ncbi:PREDICTED: TNF receptor-associated factor 5-like [Amphimedon queenslandica]|uniref:MATH domain-containing protein n=1 Tax=Amphimedon queenslandica TaxID=400682 RepID=A0AAN0JV81_AMPQE|nr:PREDICTED: TNF receptor-associated factor 5-like [Amphimedon queenslandica]|eukprot:XP_019860788.1 PREDICTED: TNF receptor-associated factor 5-like [Amphimedon queenslandica]
MNIQRKKKDEDWYSPGFYTSPGGYRMSLNVYPNGNDDDDSKGTHVSCYIHLMAGKCDDTLEWPFQGEVTIELLNQLEDKNHWQFTISFDESTDGDCKQRVTEEGSSGWGTTQFVPHSQLEYDAPTNCQYLKDDSLYFRVSVKVTSRTKPWLAL